jgi:hypothetical protein
MFDIEAFKLALNRKQKHFIAAVKDNSENLKFIPEEKRTKTVCLEAIRQSRKDDGLPLKYVPKSLQEKYPEIVLASINANPWTIEFAKYTNKEIWITAYSRDNYVLEHFGKSKEELALALEEAKQIIPRCGQALELLPVEHRSLELCTIAVNNYYPALEYVPNQTDDLCWSAIFKNPFAIDYIRDPSDLMKHFCEQKLNKQKR